MTSEVISEYFCKIPCGENIPLDNPHSVSVSLPKIQDVIDYEEGKSSVIDKMKSGYPRFFRNPFVTQLTQFIKKKYKISDAEKLIPITSIHAKIIIEKALNVSFECIEDKYKNAFLIINSEDENEKKYADFIRNAGLIISSRKAEETLYNYNLIKTVFVEETVNEKKAISNIKNTLSEAYGTSSNKVVLSNCGMNALFTATEVLVSVQKKFWKTEIVQLGWLYVDTMEIIERKENSHVQINIFDLNQLENWLERNHQKVAVLITEVVSNPLLQCVDLPRLHELCSRFSIKLIIDNTLATPYCVDVLPYCDVVVESLTKFACGNADLLFGAIIAKNNALVSLLSENVIPPFEGEVKRLGFEILDYENRVNRISENTILLHDYLKTQSKVVEIKSVFHEDSLGNFSKIQKGNLVPGLLSVVFDEDLAHYYDKLELAKGPSLGTEFTLAMPYVYLAHYDYLKSESGLSKLNELGINPNLLRISVGAEPIEDIINVFQLVLE
ncbi:PLP-dependent transferase [Flavobacterium terrigena]|uniref:Cystathionine gamma-synthase n=1 Tax=Flavobacterium terrigena TaxID=402734 RepID=A0A1H6SE33_9FLAO|nr:PLP-dependent transferase [Flavobacterium terrigena]SEI66171.1 cystathionine gamma-synthase [Flavobacterium terrigena]